MFLKLLFTWASCRTELGNLKVQGVDYAYSLQGWLKGINSDVLDSSKDMANDGQPGSLFSRVSKDVYGYKLGYFNNDYLPIGANATAFSQRSYTAPYSTANDVTGKQLFNGNISYTNLALSKIGGGATVGYTYGYDQLNRLVEMRQDTTTGAWNNSNIIRAYAESISYDANGNILKYLRKGADTTGYPLGMDSLNYKYNYDADGRLVNNKLDHVRDSVPSSNYSVDIDNQSPGNYTYDKIGNLKKDVAEGIDDIRWNVYGKINRTTKTAASTIIDYSYDAGGNRTMKQVTAGTVTTTTFYVRDAQGNVLAVYTRNNNDPVKWSEQDLYGSSRLGLWRWDTIVPASAPVIGNNDYIYDSITLGSRTYELANHLGNVLATISDKKIGVDSNGVVKNYIAEVLSQNDYYPFGMGMPGRSYIGANGYRYGFNGQEKSTEVDSNGNLTTAEFWEFDTRIGRRWNIDPKPNRAISSYSTFMGNPIWLSDPKGDTTINGQKYEAKDAAHATYLDNVTVYGKKFHQAVTPVVNYYYDFQELKNSQEISEDLVKVLWNNSDLKKKIMNNLPTISGLPNIEEISKTIMDKYAPGLYDASGAIVKNRDKPIDMAAAGVGIVQPYLGLAYDLILKRIFTQKVIDQNNLGVFDITDHSWRNTSDFNHIILDQPMLRGGDYIHAITVTVEQFYEIMDNKFFIPSDYKFYSVDQYNLRGISKNYFNGEIPAYNIYFNSLGNKGFLHISEVGIAPILINK